METLTTMRGGNLALVMDETFNAIERSSLSAQAYQAIRKALMTGELAPGQKLSGREIAARLNTSLTPVREALLQLVAEGALESRTGRMITVPLPNRRTFNELNEVRAEIEGFGAEKAASVIEPAAIDRLERIHHDLMAARAVLDTSTVLRRNEEFHFELCRQARLPSLLKIVEGLWAQTGPVLNHIYDGPEGWPVRPVPHPHLGVIDGLRRRDGKAARRALTEDIIGGCADMLRRLPE